MSCAFKKTRPERGSRVHIVSACAANIHGLAVDGQRRQLKKKKKKKGLSGENLLVSGRVTSNKQSLTRSPASTPLVFR